MNEVAVGLEIGILLLRKMKIEKQLKKTFRCFLKRCLGCLTRMHRIEEELIEINKKLLELKINGNGTVEFKNLRRSSI